MSDRQYAIYNALFDCGVHPDTCLRAVHNPRVVLLHIVYTGKLYQFRRAFRQYL